MVHTGYGFSPCMAFFLDGTWVASFWNHSHILSTLLCCPLRHRASRKKCELQQQLARSAHCMVRVASVRIGWSCVPYNCLTLEKHRGSSKWTPQIYAASHNTTRTSRFVACSYIFKKSYASHPSRFMCLEYNPRSRYIDMHINSWFANVKYNRWYTPLLASISTRRSLGTLCPLWLSSWATIPNGIEPVTSSEMSNSHWTAWSGWECGRGQS